MCAMVEKSLSNAPPRLSPLLAHGGPGVVYGITALRFDGAQIAEVMMGMIDPGLERWELRPSPTRLVEVVDRLVEGDRVYTLFPGESGRLHVGPEVKVDVLPEGTETLAVAEDRPGCSLGDLPRF